jgi:hypothetical protein
VAACRSQVYPSALVNKEVIRIQQTQLHCEAKVIHYRPVPRMPDANILTTF